MGIIKNLELENTPAGRDGNLECFHIEVSEHKFISQASW